MAKRKHEYQRRPLMPLWLSILIIAVLLVVAVALSVVAINQVNKSGDNEGFSTTSSVSFENSNDEFFEEPVAEVPEVHVENSDSAVLPLVAPERQIAQFENTAIRSEAGTCAEPGTIEVSTDAGATWNPSTSFANTTATQVLRLIPANSTNLFVVALNSDCNPQIYSTTDSGQTWQAPVSAVGTWFLDPAKPTELAAPGGVKTISCEAVSLNERTDNSVNVLCADGSLISTNDGGQSWSEPLPADGALTLAHSTGDSVVLSQQPSDCFGIQFHSNSVDAENKTCLEADLTADDAGQIAATKYGESILAWVGNTQFISKDGGHTWH